MGRRHSDGYYILNRRDIEEEDRQREQAKKDQEREKRERKWWEDKNCE